MVTALGVDCLGREAASETEFFACLPPGASTSRKQTSCPPSEAVRVPRAFDFSFFRCYTEIHECGTMER